MNWQERFQRSFGIFCERSRTLVEEYFIETKYFDRDVFILRDGLTQLSGDFERSVDVTIRDASHDELHAIQRFCIAQRSVFKCLTDGLEDRRSLCSSEESKTLRRAECQRYLATMEAVVNLRNIR